MKEKASTIEYHFDAAAARDRMAEEIKKPASRQAFFKRATGISGGKNSAVTAALCARATDAPGKAMRRGEGYPEYLKRSAAFRLNREKECFQP